MRKQNDEVTYSVFNVSYIRLSSNSVNEPILITKKKENTQSHTHTHTHTHTQNTKTKKHKKIFLLKQKKKVIYYKYLAKEAKASLVENLKQK